MTISKSFAPDLDKLHVEFKSKENRLKDMLIVLNMIPLNNLNLLENGMIL